MSTNEGLRKAIAKGFKMVFGKLRKVKGAGISSTAAVAGAHHKANADAHASARDKATKTKTAFANSRAVRDKYLAQSVATIATVVNTRLANALRDNVIAKYIAQLDQMVVEAGYEMNAPEDATLGEYLAEMEAFIENPTSEFDFDEKTQAGMKMVFGKLQKTGLAARAAGKLQGKYRPYRRERGSETTSRGGNYGSRRGRHEDVEEDFAPVYYELVKHASDQNVWFLATAELKNGGYKGLQVVWWKGDKKPKAAKQKTIGALDVSHGYYKQIKKDDLPPEVQSRFSMEESGERFKALTNKLKGKVDDPKAVAAAIGRNKYGKAKFQAMAAKGRK